MQVPSSLGSLLVCVSVRSWLLVCPSVSCLFNVRTAGGWSQALLDVYFLPSRRLLISFSAMMGKKILTRVYKDVKANMRERRMTHDCYGASLSYSIINNHWMRLSMIWRIVQIEEDGILWDLHNSSYHMKAEFNSFIISWKYFQHFKRDKMYFIELCNKLQSSQHILFSL